MQSIVILPTDATLFLASVLVRGVFVFLTLVLAATLLRGASAAVRHAVWTAGMVAVVALPLAMAMGPSVRLPVVAERVGLPLASVQSAARTGAGAGHGGRVFSAGSARDRILDGLSVDAGSTSLGNLVNVPAALFVLWILGALGLTLRDWVRRMRAQRLIARSQNIRDAGVLRLVGELRDHFRIQRPVRIVESSEVTGPATFGIIRPVVLLPAGACAWTREKLRTVLAHELAHVARQDCLTDAIARAARSIHWLNPLAWIAVRRMRLERERACDNRVLQTGVKAEPYATTLLEVARAALRHTADREHAPTAALAMAAPLELESRLLAIFDTTVNRGGLSRSQRVALAAFAASTSVFTAALRLEAAPVPTALARAEEREVAARDNAAQLLATVSPPSSTVTRAVTPVTRAVTPVTRAVTATDAHSSTNVPQRGALSQIATSEPDTRQDSVSHPRSERLPSASTRFADAARGYEAARHGADSLLASHLRASLDRLPQWEGDLVAERAAWALTRARNGRLIEPMVDELESGDWRVRAYAAWVLARAGRSALRDGRTMPRLVAALDHPVWRLRAMAAHALAAAGDASGRDAALAHVGDEAWQVRLGIVQYLAALGDASLTPVLQRQIRDRHVAVRTAAEEALNTVKAGN